MIAIFKLSNKNSASQSEANPSVRTSSKVGAPLVRACAAQMLWLIILCTPYSPLRAGELQLFTLGSGGVSGSYYAAARALCDEVNRSERGRLRCSPDPTAGSIYNLRALRQGQVDFAFVQSDWQRQAYEGKGGYANVGPMQDLRSVLGLSRSWQNYQWVALLKEFVKGRLMRPSLSSVTLTPMSDRPCQTAGSFLFRLKVRDLTLQ